MKAVINVEAKKPELGLPKLMISDSGTIALYLPNGKAITLVSTPKSSSYPGYQFIQGQQTQSRWKPFEGKLTLNND